MTDRPSPPTTEQMDELPLQPTPEVARWIASSHDRSLTDRSRKGYLVDQDATIAGTDYP